MVSSFYRRTVRRARVSQEYQQVVESTSRSRELVARRGLRMRHVVYFDMIVSSARSNHPALRQKSSVPWLLLNANR